MSVAQGNVVRVQELVDYINTNLKNVIQSQIVWHQGNLPANFPKAWAGYFQSGASLAPIMPSTIKADAVGNVVRINDVYAALQTLLLGWSCVRRVRYIYQSGNNNNGGAVTFGTRSDTTQFGLVNTGYMTDVFSMPNGNKQVIGDKIIATTMVNLISALYANWNSLATISWTYQACHTNCHSSCHGSGGFR